MQLYQISEIYKDLIDLYNEAESQGELDAILLQIESVETTLEERAENYAKIVLDAAADAKKYKAESDRLKGLEMLAASRADCLKLKLKQALESANLKNLNVGIFKIVLRANGGNPAVEVSDGIVDENGWVLPEIKLPKEVTKFIPAVKAHYEIDNQGVIDLQKTGTKLPVGIEAIRGTHLRIK